MGENLNALTGNPSASDIVSNSVAEQSGEPVIEQETSTEQEQGMEQQVVNTNVSNEGADDWQSEAKKFQSLYDKTKSDLDKAMPIINTLNAKILLIFSIYCLVLISKCQQQLLFMLQIN